MRNDPEHTTLGLVAVLLTTAVLGYAGGLAGLLAGGFLLAAWIRLPAPFPFAVAQTGIVATLGLAATPTFLLAEVGAIVLLTTSEVTTQTMGKTIGAGIGTALLLGIVAWIAIGATSVTGVSLVVLLVATVVLYGIHRYQKVSLGLVETEST